MRVRDAQVRQFLETQRGPAVDDAQLLRLLAALGDDDTQSNAQSLFAQLSGMTRAQQLDTIKANLSPDELADVAELLDRSALALTASGRNLLEAVVGRAQLSDVLPAIQVDAQGAITGTVGTNETVEVLNLSTAAVRSARTSDTVEVARADHWGKFSARVGDASVGDTLRIQTRNAQGRVTSWLNVRVMQQGAWDNRAAFVDVNRLLIRPRNDGNVTIEHRLSSPLTEPGATLRLNNTRTGNFVDVKADDHGQIPAVTLPGQAGDQITVALSDGAGNTDFSLVAATLTVKGTTTELPDPGPLNKDGSIQARKAEGSLFNGSARPQDVAQGQIGNCYVPAAAAAVAHADPELLKELITPNDDGTFTVLFRPGGGAAVQISVDADLYMGWNGEPKYGRGIKDGNTAAPLWFSLLEKAWAAHRGSYEVVGQGGSVGQMLSDITGRPNKEHWLRDSNAQDTWSALQDGIRNQRAMAAGTYGTQEAARYTNTGVYANHAYSVLGAVEENGQRLVILRNPWGSGEPVPDDKPDGIFKLPLEKFLQLYQVLNIC